MPASTMCSASGMRREPGRLRLSTSKSECFRPYAMDAAVAVLTCMLSSSRAHSLAARIDDLLGSLRTRDVSSLSGSLVDTMRRAHREYEQRCLMLERVADLCSALEALLKQRGVNTDVGGADGDEGGASDATAAAEGPLFLRMLRPKLHQAHSELGELLSDTAGRLLRGAWDDEDGDEDDTTRAMPSCLRAFALCDNASAIEHLIATELVQGVLSDTFTPGRLDGGSRGQFKGASSCFEALVSFIRAPRVRRILVASAGIHGLDVAGNAIWAPAVHALLNGFPSFFSAGLPDVFVANFDAFHSFMDSMFEGFEESLPGAPLALRLHPATLEVETKWHRALPVYFQVRSREVRAPVEEALQRSVEAAPPSEGDAETGLYLSASTAVWKALICLWKPGVYVPALASRFLKLTAQAVGRYVAWLSAPRQLKDKRREKPSGQSAGGAGGAVADASAAKKARDEAGSGESGEEGETSDRAGADDSSCWKGVTADALLAASCDARRIRELVRSILVGRMRSAVDEIDGASDVGAPVLYAAVEPLSAVSEQLRELVARQLKDRCVAGLAHVRGIPATYRMTSKPLPISHSQFVEKVFAYVSGLLPLSLYELHTHTVVPLQRCAVRCKISSVLTRHSCPHRLKTRVLGLLALQWLWPASMNRHCSRCWQLSRRWTRRSSGCVRLVQARQAALYLLVIVTKSACKYCTMSAASLPMLRL